MTKINKKGIISFIENYKIKHLIYLLLGLIPGLIIGDEKGNLRFVAGAGVLFSMYHLFLFIVNSLLNIDFNLPHEKKYKSINNKEILFESDSNKPNLIAHFIQFGFIITILFHLIKKTLLHPSSFIFYAFAILVMLLILFYYLKRKNREPSFVTISTTQITFRSFFYFLKQKIELNQIKGYSFIKKPYYVNKGRTKKLYPSYLIYMKDDSKKILIDYNINNFEELNINLKKAGIKYLGIDEPEWLGPRKKYKFD